MTACNSRSDSRNESHVMTACNSRSSKIMDITNFSKPILGSLHYLHAKPNRGFGFVRKSTLTPGFTKDFSQKSLMAASDSKTLLKNDAVYQVFY